MHVRKVATVSYGQILSFSTSKFHHHISKNYSYAVSVLGFRVPVDGFEMMHWLPMFARKNIWLTTTPFPRKSGKSSKLQENKLKQHSTSNLQLNSIPGWFIPNPCNIRLRWKLFWLVRIFSSELRAFFSYFSLYSRDKMRRGNSSILGAILQFLG